VKGSKFWKGPNSEIGNIRVEECVICEIRRVSPVDSYSSELNSVPDLSSEFLVGYYPPAWHRHPDYTAPKKAPEARTPRTHDMAKDQNTPFWFGGSASCMAAVCTHPLWVLYSATHWAGGSWLECVRCIRDLVKVRLQTAGKQSVGMAKTAMNIIRHEGVVLPWSFAPDSN
jgi:hypothetical protein